MRTTYRRLPSSTSPALTEASAARSRARTSLTVRRNRASRNGSISTRSSRRLVPYTSTRPTPGTRSSRSWTTSSTNSPKVWIGRSCPGWARMTIQAIELSSLPEVRSSGSLASAGYPDTRSRRFATSSSALSMSMSTLNSRLIRARPSCAELSSAARPSRPLNASSWRLTISRSISAGEPPLQLVVTVMTGRATSGVSWMGMVRSASAPNIVTMRTAAMTARGRAIE